MLVEEFAMGQELVTAILELNNGESVTVILMLNKNTYGAKKARPKRSSSYLTIHATKSFDIS